jgi:hypothetical protein
LNLRALFHRPANEDFPVPFGLEITRGQMLSKCSNPGCSATFRRLRTGKLFRFDSPHRQLSENGTIPKPPRGVEFFWLCETCAPNFTLVSNSTEGTRVVSIAGRARGAATGS